MDDTRAQAAAKSKTALQKHRNTIIMLILVAIMAALVVWSEREIELPNYSGEIM
ncbi:hypothetical protein GTP55_25595 [Duganella sp. FT109W]|uniref:Uncharacterized protein n=1 Tax=Duganella margarita TaxID=2692170 RepID=A0ABW9WR55_9BURK|nr:hypothetical protein [Duganella margarita]MYN42722.1 hypothetical protein [Duganella margarita]